MYKLLFIALLGFGGYKAYEHFSQHEIALYDDAGDAITVIFIADNCPPCRKITRLLDERRVSYIEQNISQDSEATKLMQELGGGRMFPYLVSGSGNVHGSSKQQVISVLAESLGERVLTASEKRAHSHHFDTAGSPQLVMYSTVSCGYCRQAREYFEANGLRYYERDIERDSAAKRDFKVLESRGTPLIYYGYKRIDGWNKQKMARLADDII